MTKLPSEAELLRTVRDFMTGTNEMGESVTRQDLPQLSPRRAVHVGMAMILARPEQFLETVDGVRYIRGNLEHTLIDLLYVGVTGSNLGGSALVSLCRDARLYESTPGRGGRKRVRPPTWSSFIALVDELKNHPAVDAFFDEVDENIRIRNLPKLTAVTGPNASPQIRAKRVLAWLEQQDPDAVHALRALLHA